MKGVICMKIIWREWTRSKQAVRMMLVYLMLSIIYTGINAWIVQLISGTVTSTEEMFLTNLVILAGVCAVQMVIGPIRQHLSSKCSRLTFTTCNNALAKKVSEADAELFTKYTTSYVLEQFEYIGKIVSFEENTANRIIDMAKIISTLIGIWMIGGRLILYVLVTYLIGGFIIYRIFLKFDEYDTKKQKLMTERNQEVEDVVNGFMEVRTFHTGPKRYGIIKGKNKELYNFGTKRSKLIIACNVLFEGVDTIGLIIVIWYAFHAMMNGTMNAANGMALVMYVFRVVDPLCNILDYIAEFSDKKSGAKKFDVVMSYQNANKPAGNIVMENLQSGIEIKDVSFAYDSTGNVLKHVNLSIPKGKKIGICGISGAGKSTLFKLLSRFYDESSGEILIDGVDIHEVTMESYRKHVGCVHQQNTIFPGTIMSNLLYGNESAMEYEIIEACKKANVLDFINSLPDRFETQVGPRGITLSGGQQQRIALARLFIRNPEIVLLDEATSALDNESESLVQDAIDALEGRTLITIAHRLSTIRNSDIIYVMGNGGVLESGTHDELIALRGAYYSMQK